MKRYRLIVIGGSFDHLHNGHRYFISSSLDLTDKMVIGLTSDRYLREIKQIEGFLPFEEREKQLLEYIKSIGRADDVVINPLEKNEIPHNLQDMVEAVVVTSDTLSGAKDLNHERLIKGLSPLSIIEIPLMDGVNGEKISSSKIRSGEVDDKGEPYFPKGLLDKNLKLSDSLREELKKPFGTLFKDLNSLEIESPIVSVGDVATKSFLDLGITPWISIVDFVVERKKTFYNIMELGFLETDNLYKVRNDPSTLSHELFKLLQKVFTDYSKRSIVFVDGEEDLAVLPAILFAPLGTVIYYGQPGEGVVRVFVDSKMKEKARLTLLNFEIQG